MYEVRCGEGGEGCVFVAEVGELGKHVGLLYGLITGGGEVVEELGVDVRVQLR